MDIEYKGANCVLITTKKETFVIDPKLSDVGLKDQGQRAAVQLLTQPQFGAPHSDETIVIDGPGEYEVHDVSIKGIPAQAHLDPKGSSYRATMYRLEIADISVVVIGHVHPDLSDDQLEALGIVDVVIIPVGGNGYTLDATGAVQVIKKIEPKIIIPTHYAEAGINYPVPQADIETFVKDLGAVHETSSKLKLKAGTVSEILTIQQLDRTA